MADPPKILLEKEVVAEKLRKRDFEFLSKFGIFKAGISMEDGKIIGLWILLIQMTNCKNRMPETFGI